MPQSLSFHRCMSNVWQFMFDKKMFSLDHIPVMISQVCNYFKCAFNADGVLSISSNSY